jgi:hypothetical protein
MWELTVTGDVIPRLAADDLYLFGKWQLEGHNSINLSDIDQRMSVMSVKS